MMYISKKNNVYIYFNFLEKKNSMIKKIDNFVESYLNTLNNSILKSDIKKLEKAALIIKKTT